MKSWIFDSLMALNALSRRTLLQVLDCQLARRTMGQVVHNLLRGTPRTASPGAHLPQVNVARG